MGLKVTVTFEAKDTETLLDAVDGFTDEMFEKYGITSDVDEPPTELAAADSDNWSYTVKVVEVPEKKD